MSEKSSKVGSVLASIPLSILGALEVHIIFGLTNLIISLVFWLLLYIPILSSIVEWWFRIGENTPDMVAMFVAVMVAYICTNITATHIIKKTETRKLTLTLSGIYLIVFNAIFIIINLKYNDAILANVLLGIAGIAILYKGKNT